MKTGLFLLIAGDNGIRLVLHIPELEPIDVAALAERRIGVYESFPPCLFAGGLVRIAGNRPLYLLRAWLASGVSSAIREGPPSGVGSSSASEVRPLLHISSAGPASEVRSLFHISSAGPIPSMYASVNRGQRRRPRHVRKVPCALGTRTETQGGVIRQPCSFYHRMGKDAVWMEGAPSGLRLFNECV